MLQIRKLSTKTWKHIDTNDGAFILTKFYAKEESNEFLIVESYGSKRRKYLINEIEVYDIGGIAETFANFEDLFLRLEELRYTGFYKDGDIDLVWGSITGTLSDQTDLQNALNSKLDKVTTNDVEKVYIKNADGTQGMKAVSEICGGTTPTLQQVTDIGNVTTNEIFAGGFVSGASGFFGGILFNDGILNETASLSSLATPINPRYYILPDKNGTIAIEEDTVAKVSTAGVERAYIINADGSQGTKATSEFNDVLEFANLAAFPVTGESGKIYVALDTNLQYRWSGSAYVQISDTGKLDKVSTVDVEKVYTKNADGTQGMKPISEFQTDISGKLDKVTTTGVERVYTINADGSQNTKPTSNFKEVIEGYFNGTNFYTDALFTNLITPESGRVYVALNTNSTYRWSGSGYVKIGGIQGGFLGSVIPTDTPTGTGEAFWNATQAGTYTNFGGVVVASNSFAFISRDASGNFSISQTDLDLSAYAQKTQVLNESAISLGLDSVSIDNDFSANFTEFQNFNGGVISLDAGRLKVVASTGSKGVGIIPSYVENAKEHTVVFEIDLGTSASVLFYNKWANVIHTITASGTYEITFTSDNSGAFPYPIFASSNAGTFYLNYLKLKKANLNRYYSLKKETQKALDFTPITISKTDFLTIPSYVSAYNGGVLSIESEKLKVVAIGQQGFRITGLTPGAKYSLQFHIDIGTTTGVKIFSANPNLVTTITKTGFYDITIPSVNFGVVEFLSNSAGTILVDYLNIYQNVKWVTENQLRVVEEKTDLTGGNFDTRLKIGLNSISSDNESTAVGGNSQATQDKSTAIGVDAQATFSNLYDAGASNNGENIALGNQAKAFSWRAVAIGNKSIAGATSTVALGYGAVVNKVHGIAIGRGAYLPNISAIENGATIVGADLSNDYYLANGWGHRFKTPPSGIAISNITPSTTTKRYHGQDAFDELDGTQQNVQGGNVALSAGRGTGSAKGGKLLLETAPSTGLKGGNEKNDLVAGAAVTSETTTNTRFQLLDNATGTLKDVKYYIDGSSRKILYID